MALNRMYFGYHDSGNGLEPEEITLQHIEEGDSDYYRLKYGYDLVVFTSADRLRELRDKIDAALKEAEPQPVVTDGMKPEEIPW